MRGRLPTKLVGKRWNLPAVGTLVLADVTHDHLRHIDDEWPPARRADDWHHSWRWRDLVSGRVEAFAAVRAGDRVAGIWCSAKKRPLRLPEGEFYRPDYLEVSPELRGTGIGVFLFALIATRAVELGAHGVVLGTWSVLRSFYTGLGGIERKPRGWNLEPNLVPFTFDSAALTDLIEALATMEEHV